MSGGIGRIDHKGYLIEITQEIINAAIRADSSSCVIADAIKAQLGGKRVMVDLQSVRWTDEKAGLRYIALTPAKGQRCILDFDKGEEIKPFTLRLYPFQSVRSGKRQGKGEFVKKVTPKTKRTGPNSSSGHGQAYEGRREYIGNPDIEGGKLPPSGALSNFHGKRRTFGLRLAG